MKTSKELFEAVMGMKCKSILGEQFIFFEMEDGYKPDYGISINDFFFKCIDFMKDNDIQYYLNIDNDIRSEVFEFLNKWILDNKDTK